ncbi:hypothetical protein CFE70_007490 [Pyrenophora teres f. teres 0-1]|uniref:Uncharacterized protein n=1 Tax=Pyrenophora teres f. teres (strain 0-1) TaxID=861557 RepID=E3RFI7_PYRTT|nr:hypothetical protein PTT_06475 [Pyrenophora teres f. teres 0-1]
MLKLFVASLLSSAVHAQHNLTYINLMYRAEPTLTFVSSDATATTYRKVCEAETTTPTPSSSTEYIAPSLITAGYENGRSVALSYYATALPASTPLTAPSPCIPFTLFQGPETWGFHLTNAAFGGLTKNGECTWTGVFTEVPITCDGDARGGDYGSVVYPSGQPSVWSQSDLRATEELKFAVASVLGMTPPASTAMPTRTGTGAEAGSKATGSEGGIAGGPRPTGLVAMAGGAVGVGVAAFVL